VKEAKASVKGNLLWRTIALNQQEGVAEVDAALQTAISLTTPQGDHPLFASGGNGFYSDTV
jgi:hypothetical protein